MCLRKPKDCKFETADRDIVVYKILRKNRENRYITPVMKTPVRLGDTIRSASPIEDAVGNESVCGEGVHAYREKAVAAKTADNYNIWSVFDRYVIAKAVIPKGERFYVGLCGDIAAGSIRILKIVHHTG